MNILEFYGLQRSRERQFANWGSGHLAKSLCCQESMSVTNA